MIQLSEATSAVEEDTRRRGGIRDVGRPRGGDDVYIGFEGEEEAAVVEDLGAVEVEVRFRVERRRK